MDLAGPELAATRTLLIATYRELAMDVFRIQSEGGRWTLLKAHGYKPIMVAESLATLIEHVQASTHGRGAVIRFDAEGGVRELRVGVFDDDEY